MAYHYINVIDDYRDIITTLKERFNIEPEVVYYIGYQYNNIPNDAVHKYFLYDKIELNKIQQTMETPDIIIINNNIDHILFFIQF